MPVSSKRKKTKKRASHLNAHPNDLEARMDPVQVERAIKMRSQVVEDTIVEE